MRELPVLTHTAHTSGSVGECCTGAVRICFMKQKKNDISLRRCGNTSHRLNAHNLRSSYMYLFDASVARAQNKSNEGTTL